MIKAKMADRKKRCPYCQKKKVLEIQKMDVLANNEAWWILNAHKPGYCLIKAKMAKKYPSRPRNIPNDHKPGYYFTIKTRTTKKKVPTTKQLFGMVFAPSDYFLHFAKWMDFQTGNEICRITRNLNNDTLKTVRNTEESNSIVIDIITSIGWRYRVIARPIIHLFPHSFVEQTHYYA